MVNWYKRDIPAWMDDSESLDAEPYRTYDVICLLIYLNEGPIALNEHGIAGRCKQHILKFRACLKVLLDLGKLRLIDGKLTNDLASTQLQSLANHRATSSQGGRGRAEVGPRLVNGQFSKPLENNDTDPGGGGPREEKTREEKKEESCLSADSPKTRKRNSYSQDFEDRFWKLYAKGSKPEAFKQWQRLSEEDRIDACKAIVPYQRSISDRQFWCDSCRYLSRRHWENFISNGTALAPVFNLADRRVDPRL